MPIYIDRHLVPGTTPEQLAAAHVQDLEVEDSHGVHYHSYWFDPESGAVFCLAEGPSREAVQAVHRDSHGLEADQIIELTPTAPLNAMFGSIPSFAPGTAYAEPAMRAIVFTDMRGSVAQTQRIGDDAHMAQLDVHDDIVRSELTEHQGREVKHTGDGIMAAFNSAVSAVNFARQVLRRLSHHNSSATHAIDLSIGITAGEPVARGSDDLFGTAVQMAARLCAVAQPGEIAVSSVIFEMCNGKLIEFDDIGKVDLKGVAEPVQAFRVRWSD